MITEDYVSFETAKLLKEKGFDIPYNSFRGVYINGVLLNPGDGYRFNYEDEIINVCSLQMAMKWLREKRCIIVVNPTWFTADGCKKWSYSIWADDNLEVDGENPDKRTEYDSYEETCDVAIKYCLTNLI